MKKIFTILTLILFFSIGFLNVDSNSNYAAAQEKGMVPGNALGLKSDADLLRNLENNFKMFKCNLLTVNKIVADKKEKLNLAKKFKSISTIDMEAFHIKKELLKVNIPMLSIKVIFDDLSFDLPSFIKDCVDNNGELRILTLSKKLLFNPSIIFDLLKLNIKFLKSKRVLGGLINNF